MFAPDIERRRKVAFAIIIDSLTLPCFTSQRYGTPSRRGGYPAGLSGGKSVMAERHLASSNAGACPRPAEHEQFLDLLRRWVFETEQAILESRALIRSTQDAIELLDRLQVSRLSN
jgi:hypothetical protein